MGVGDHTGRRTNEDVDLRSIECLGELMPVRLACINPKLRLAGVADPALVWDFAIVKVRRSGYLRARGMAAPMSWKASRWVLVGSARIGTVAVVPAKRT